MTIRGYIAAGIAAVCCVVAGWGARAARGGAGLGEDRTGAGGLVAGAG